MKVKYKNNIKEININENSFYIKKSNSYENEEIEYGAIKNLEIVVDYMVVTSFQFCVDYFKINEIILKMYFSEEEFDKYEFVCAGEYSDIYDLLDIKNKVKGYKFTLDGPSKVNTTEVNIDSIIKTYCLTGVKLGYFVTSAELIAYLNSIAGLILAIVICYCDEMKYAIHLIIYSIMFVIPFVIGNLLKIKALSKLPELRNIDIKVEKPNLNEPKVTREEMLNLLSGVKNGGSTIQEVNRTLEIMMKYQFRTLIDNENAVKFSDRDILFLKKKNLLIYFILLADLSFLFYLIKYCH